MTHAALNGFIPLFLASLAIIICYSKAAKRNKPVVSKKEPISADIIRIIIDKHAGPSANLKDSRLACMCSLAFVGFLRYGSI